MILDGAGNVDRLLVAIAQVDRSTAHCVVRIAHALLSRCQPGRGIELPARKISAAASWRGEVQRIQKTPGLLSGSLRLRWQMMRILYFGKGQL